MKDKINEFNEFDGVETNNLKNLNDLSDLNNLSILNDLKNLTESNRSDEPQAHNECNKLQTNKLYTNESGEPLRNIRLTLEFDGTDFNGWQVQADKRTVQGEMERAIKKVTGETLRVNGCSRTDAGVHARGYVMNFYTGSKIPAEKLFYPLNDKLPFDIRVLDSRETDVAFHARKHSVRKTYSYCILNQEQRPAIGRQYVHREKGRLDEVAMQEALSLFKGTHDFVAFRSTGSSAKTTIRTIFAISLDRAGNQFTLSVTGDGFLYNMVRIMVGTLLDVGHGTRTPEDVRQALATGNRLKAGKVAPAKGLTLEEVEY